MGIRFAFADESYKHVHGIFDKKTAIGDLKQDEQTIVLVSGNNDWPAFQFLLKSDEDFTLSLGDQPFFAPKGPLENIRLQVSLEGLPKGAVSVYPVGFVEDDDRLMKSEILLEDRNVFVERFRVQPVWIEATVPPDWPSGTYTGEIRVFSHRMFAGETLVKTFRFTLRVLDVTLGSPRDNGFHLNLWLHMSNIARKHEAALWSDAHFEVLERYVESLAGLGQKSVMAIVSEIPWSAQNCFKVVNYPSDLFEYSMIGVIKLKSGKYQYDYSALERFIRLCFRHGQPVPCGGIMPSLGQRLGCAVPRGLRAVA